MPGWRPVRQADLTADDAHIYSRELYDAEYQAAERLTQLLVQDAPLFKPDELESAIRQAEKDHEIVLGADRRRAIATALTRQVSIISGGPGVGKTTSVRILVELLERRGVPYVLLSPTGKAAKRRLAYLGFYTLARVSRVIFEARDGYALRVAASVRLTSIGDSRERAG